MGIVEPYLVGDILIKGGLDTLLLILFGRLNHLPIRPKRILLGAWLGEIPVIMACYSDPMWTTLSKWVIPLLMVGTAFPTRRLNTYFKALAGFWLLSSGLGGFVYATWGWVQFGNGLGEVPFSLALYN